MHGRVALRIRAYLQLYRYGPAESSSETVPVSSLHQPRMLSPPPPPTPGGGGRAPPPAHPPHAPPHIHPTRPIHRPTHPPTHTLDLHPHLNGRPPRGPPYRAAWVQKSWPWPSAGPACTALGFLHPRPGWVLHPQRGRHVSTGVGRGVDRGVATWAHGVGWVSGRKQPVGTRNPRSLLSTPRARARMSAAGEVCSGRSRVLL